MKFVIVQCITGPTYFKFSTNVKNKILSMWTYEFEAILSLILGPLNCEQQPNYNGMAFNSLQNVITTRRQRQTFIYMSM